MQKVSPKASTELFGRVGESTRERVDGIIRACRRDDLDVCPRGARVRRRNYSDV